MPAQTYDCIVIGTGGVGSACLYELARRGCRTLGIDQFAPAHDRGSSHGQTRMIRQAYFEHPDYVPLVLRAFERWHELEQQSGQQLYNQVGLLQVGPREGPILAGVRRSAEEYSLPLEELSPREIESRFPAFRTGEETIGLLEQRAGYLLVERTVATYLEQAQVVGAQHRPEEPVKGWKVAGDGVQVTTHTTTYHAKQLIITAGAWAAQLLAELHLPLVVRRKSSFWMEPLDDAHRPLAPCPAVLFETDSGVFYALPQVDDSGVKVADHSGGRAVSDPTAVDRDIDPSERDAVLRFAAAHLPRLSARVNRHSVCMYTLTPDEHFIVDRHPEHENVALAAGLSGHGFKFCGVLAEALVDLLLTGETELPIGFLQIVRSALR